MGAGGGRRTEVDEVPLMEWLWVGDRESAIGKRQGSRWEPVGSRVGEKVDLQPECGTGGRQEDGGVVDDRAFIRCDNCWAMWIKRVGAIEVV